MKVEELRVGNIIYQPNGALGKLTSNDIAYLMSLSQKTALIIVGYRGVELSGLLLKRAGFRLFEEGRAVFDKSTYVLELIYSGGFWYPAITQFPEMIEPEQTVHLPRIQKFHELQNLVKYTFEVELDLEI